MSLLQSGLFEHRGIKTVGIAGHLDGRPTMNTAELWAALAEKDREVTDRGMAPLVAQFGFDADPLLAWLGELRERGITALFRIGVPGPAGIKTLLRFAAHCGVGATASVMSKYGVSLTKLLGTAGPDRLIEALGRGITPGHQAVRLHRTRLVADVAFDEIDHVRAATPVPGGVGPMTIACLLANTMRAAHVSLAGPRHC